MVSFHRKTLLSSSNDSCPPPRPTLPNVPPRVLFSPPPPRPPPRPPFNESYSPVLVVLFGGLAVSACFICYLICATRYLRRRPNRENTNYEAHEDFLNGDHGPVTLHPIWLINTIGLDQSQIESIQLLKYKRDEKLIEDTDCSVCLSEFEDDESLRVLPKCNHAFHVPCIDTWLRSHKNCPLCRSLVFNNANDQPNLTASSTHEETETETIPVNDSETTDDHGTHHVVEVDNIGEMVKTFSILDETSSSSVQGEELAPIRRSFSNGQLVVSKKPSGMPKREHKRKGSSSSIRDFSKVTKTSSFALPLRKASSFTSKSRPLNQSY